MNVHDMNFQCQDNNSIQDYDNQTAFMYTLDPFYWLREWSAGGAGNGGGDIEFECNPVEGAQLQKGGGQNFSAQASRNTRNMYGR